MALARRLTPTARHLRRTLTDAERVLWERLRAHRFHGLKFKRQEPLGNYVVDFICYDVKIIIELDGGHHADQVDDDEKRTRWLESRGYRVIRFWNNDVLRNTDGVVESLEGALVHLSRSA